MWQGRCGMPPVACGLLVQAVMWQGNAGGVGVTVATGLTDGSRQMREALPERCGA